ncbi:MAG: hypothetical protein AAGD22_13530 [Verrucomicrobiota bacterium]
MLREITGVRQIPGEPPRRWFQSERLDLFVWYGEDQGILGFRLCYRLGGRERAVTWLGGQVCLHQRVDEGREGRGYFAPAPILFPGAEPLGGDVVILFSEESRGLERGLADLILGKLGEFAAVDG